MIAGIEALWVKFRENGGSGMDAPAIGEGNPEDIFQYILSFYLGPGNCC